MPIVPLMQTVKVYKKDGSDGWGGKTTSVPITMKCRFQEGVDKEELMRLGMTDLVLNAKVIFYKYPDITLEDKIEYTDEHGRTRVYEARAIDVLRGISGKPMFTVVLV